MEKLTQETIHETNISAAEQKAGLSMLDGVKSRLAIVAMSAVAAFGASADKAEGNKIGLDNAIETPKSNIVIGQNRAVPDNGSNEASISQSEFSLKNYCVREGTKRPKISESIVKHPGDKKTQSIGYEAAYSPMPEACHGVFRRVPLIKFQFENPDRFKTKTHKDRWLNIIPFKRPHFSEFLNPEEAVGVNEPRYIGNEGGIGEAVFAPSYPFGRIHDKTKQYRCTPGKRITHGRVVIRNAIKNLANKHNAGSETFVAPLEIKRDYNGARGLSTPQKMRGATGQAC